MNNILNKLNTLISYDEIISQIKTVAFEINKFYQDKVSFENPLYSICVLKGGVMFYAELLKYLNIPLKMQFVTLSSYGDNLTSSGQVEFKNLDLGDLSGKNVLVIDDIIDTGLTLNAFINHLKNKFDLNSLKSAVLLNKRCRRKVDFNPDYSMFDIDDKFVVGFGMDYKGLFRNLNYVAYLNLEE